MFTKEELEQIKSLYENVTLKGMDQAKIATSVYDKVCEELNGGKKNEK